MANGTRTQEDPEIPFQKIQQLNDIVADLDTLVTEIGTDFYRVSIFGSARIKPDTDLYHQVYELAFQLASRGVDIVTGGDDDDFG